VPAGRLVYKPETGYSMKNFLTGEYLLMEKLTLDRDMYRRIKQMNRDAMEKTMQNVYESGWNDALSGNGGAASETVSSGSASVDMDKLREELSKISGVGAKRLDEIMEVITKVTTA